MPARSSSHRLSANVCLACTVTTPSMPDSSRTSIKSWIRKSREKGPFSPKSRNIGEWSISIGDGEHRSWRMAFEVPNCFPVCQRFKCDLLFQYSSRHALDPWRLSSLYCDRSIKSCSLEFRFKMLGQKIPAKTRHRIIDPAIFIGLVTPEMLVGVDAHERFTRFLKSAAPRSSRPVAAIRRALQSPTRRYPQT